MTRVILYPTNDTDRLAFLRTALAVAQQDQSLGRPRLHMETMTNLASQLQAFDTARQDVIQAKAAYGQARIAADSANRALQAKVRQVWSTVNWRVRWQGVSSQVRTFYGLPQDGPTPFPTSRAGWLAVAEQILAGDPQAVEAGFESAMDAGAFQPVLDQAQTALDALAGAKQDLRLAQKQLATLRRSVDRLTRRIAQDLRYALRDEAASLQREIMRTYGIRFERNPGEAEDDTLILDASGSSRDMTTGPLLT